MTRRAAALAAVAAVAAGTLALGVAAPASAAGLIDYRAYQQTLPASVIDGGTLTDEEKVAWTNGTRAGTIDKPVAPIGSSPFTRGIGGSTSGSIFGATSALFYISDQLRADQDFDRADEKPSWIDQDEWDACATSGGDDWLGNIFDGARDWFASFDGIDCNEVREGWEVERNPDYAPTNVGAGIPGGYPQVSQGTISTTTYTVSVLQPFWSNVPTATGADHPSRVYGWVYPMNFSPTSAIATVWVELVGPGGTVVYSSQTSITASSGKVPNSVDAQCLSVSGCFEAMPFATGTGLPSVAQRDAQQLMARFTAVKGSPTNAPKRDLGLMPYINPLDGSSPQEGAQPVVMMTTVWTEAGNRYSCTTESFVETAPTVPRPCEPAVPDWEIITERIVEVVPETEAPSYVPGSNPTRGIQTTTIPEVVRDWQREHPGCDETLCLLDLELEGVGSCFDNPDECAGWYQRADKNSVMRCTYGGTQVDLAQCVKYARLFEPNAITSGTAYPQPSAPNPAQTPSGQTGSSPATATPPGSSAANPSQPRDCWPTGWGIFNPFEWVYKPVRCVMEWAFVPRNEVVQNMVKGMRAKWAGSSLVSLLGVLEQGSDLVLGGTGCAGPTVSVNVFGGAYSGNPLSACADPMAGVAAFSRTFTMVAAWVMAIASIARSIAGVVGFTKLGGDS